jgi:predicted Abi (CAAX) family protease
MFAKFKKAMVTWPTQRAWLETFILWLIFASIALPVALYYQFIGAIIFFNDWLPMALMAFFIPSFIEEIIWRGLLTPAPGSRACVMC